MRENAPNQQDSNRGENDPLRQALLRPIQHQLAKQGIHVSPEEALKLLELQIEYDAKRYLQYQLAEQGLTVSPEEALELNTQKMVHDFKLKYQQELAEQGTDVSPDEADAIDKLQFYHRLMERFGPTDPHETI
jgi:hypothetical protein